MVINLSPQVEKALAMLNDAGFEAYLVGERCEICAW